ncbi:hypothetical protein C8F04DRAFT_1179656 [Mycena alexandri]|uniref:Uncharacterized protein n=1 Tax=Mycena alexandri TaxID=1745969 RepID=A0AAD6T3Q4_9AGAR|nr:hypothetical protein C8F04DRAFT_1179656 [Mycena alexandri]
MYRQRDEWNLSHRPSRTTPGIEPTVAWAPTCQRLAGDLPDGSLGEDFPLSCGLFTSGKASFGNSPLFWGISKALTKFGESRVIWSNYRVYQHSAACCFSSDFKHRELHSRVLKGLSRINVQVWIKSVAASPKVERSDWAILRPLDPSTCTQALGSCPASTFPDAASQLRFSEPGGWYRQWFSDMIVVSVRWLCEWDSGHQTLHYRLTYVLSCGPLSSLLSCNFLTAIPRATSRLSRDARSSMLPRPIFGDPRRTSLREEYPKRQDNGRVMAGNWLVIPGNLVELETTVVKCLMKVMWGNEARHSFLAQASTSGQHDLDTTQVHQRTYLYFYTGSEFGHGNRNGRT